MENVGLPSNIAFNLLIQEAKTIIGEWYSINVVNKLKPQNPNKIRTFSRFFCSRSFVFIRLTLILLIIGSVDIENNIVVSSVFIYFLLLIFSILLEIWQNRVRSNSFQLKYLIAFDEIQRIETSFPASFQYNSNDVEENVSDDATTFQTCIRDGCHVQVPRVLLVKGDVVVFRPGQHSPCQCETFDGRIINEGQTIEWKIDENKQNGTVKPLESIQARVIEYPIRDHLETFLSSEEANLQFDFLLQFTIHRIFEKFIIPIIFVLSAFSTTIRFIYSDDESLFGTRFIISVPGLTIFPLLILQLPLLLHLIKYLNNLDVCKYLNLNISTFHTSKDFVNLLSSITGTSFLDKKGTLSSAHPSIEKIVFATKLIESPEIIDDGNLHLEVINLFSEQNPDDSSKWNLSIEDPNWHIYIPNLLPISYNLLLNSCRQSKQFHRFLDHLSVVAKSVPRTIATANRRCMCQLPELLGFNEKSVEHFDTKNTNILGIYKKQPGEASLPGLTKHRTPIEMAFCTIHQDPNSLYSHLSCQGTANIVVDSCTHIWNGQRVVPMTKRLIGSVKDFYQRYSMTGHCLAVSYRPILSKIDPKLDGMLIEIPLNHDFNRLNNSIPRSHSFESLNGDEYSKKSLKTSEEIIEECFTGNILCGLVVLHYEAIPQAVAVIEKLDSICVRPIYFSKENELRSRVFAEKLGIEAGWNCHISLAEEEPTRKQIEIAHEQFIPQKPLKSAFYNRKNLSDIYLERLDCESLIRGSPSIRKSSVISPKVGPIPNMARLPTGVKNIRPHLDDVDNVPLLVGLFTDSTIAAVEEMIDILQENGEVLMVIGSSKNMNNSMLFSKANISICIDDIEENSCRLINKKNENNVNEIASRLIALGTDFRLNHKMLLKLPELINCCRHRMSSLRHSLLFLLYSSILISSILLLSTSLFLPIIFTHSQILLTTLFHIPILFCGTIFTSFEPRRCLIRIAPKNVDEVSRVEQIKVFSTFLMQFFPTSIYINFLFFVLLMSNSNLMCSFSDISCIFNTDGGAIGSKPTTINETLIIFDESLSTDTIRHIMGFQLTSCLCFLSSAYVFGLSSFWIDIPFQCFYWNISIIICFLSQIFYSYLRGIRLIDLFSIVPLIVLLIWICVIIIINELIKIRRIRQFTREQRRTKFDFDTKLGMNSPY